MEIVNKNYIKLDRFDILGRIVQVVGNDEYSSNLNRLIFDYGKQNKIFIKEIFINKNNSSLNKVLDLNYNIPIKRESIRNAILYATITDNRKIASYLSKYIHLKEIYPIELGHLLEYVLDNSMDINEVFDGERKKIIFDEKNNELFEGYIYKSNNIKKLEKK